MMDLQPILAQTLIFLFCLAIVIDDPFFEPVKPEVRPTVASKSARDIPLQANGRDSIFLHLPKL